MNTLAVAAQPSTAFMPSTPPAANATPPEVVSGGGSASSTGKSILRIALIVGGLGVGLIAGGAIGAVLGLATGALLGAAMLSHAAATTRL